MNDFDRRSDKSAGVRRDIEDSYPEYAEHEYGYAYDAWDLLSLGETDRHDRLIAAPLEELDALEVDALDDLQRLAVARGYRRHGEHESFVRVCRRILQSDSRHPAVVYPEVAVLAARDMMTLDRPQALAWLEEFDEYTEELMEARILRAVVHAKLHDSRDRLEDIAAEHADESEWYYEVAEECWRQQMPEMALEWLATARDMARTFGDRAILIDIELLTTRLEAPNDGDAVATSRD